MAMSDLFNFDSIADDAAKARRSDVAADTMRMITTLAGPAASQASSAPSLLSATPTSATQTSQSQSPYRLFDSLFGFTR